MTTPMESDREVLRTAVQSMDAGDAFVLVTVVRTQGSTPRDAGARMIWRPGHEQLGDTLVGTVGGGQFEHMVIDTARRCYKERTHATEHFVLGADAGQCCGGTMDVFFEYHGRSACAVIFGAGHVSHALAELLAPSPLSIVIVDNRPEWNSVERFPRARRVMSIDEGVAIAHVDPARTLACVMTCSHDDDFEILRKLLPTPPAFTGLIGSRSKRACFVTRLSAAGFDEQTILRVQCPIGVGDTGKEPQAVAISIAAQLLMEAKSLAHA